MDAPFGWAPTMPNEGWRYDANPIGTSTTRPQQWMESARPSDPVVTTVGGEPITAGQLREMVRSAWQTAGSVSDGGLSPTGAAMGAIRAYHGSPHSFERFDMSKIGTGEGAQAYGHGMYFAGNEGVARGYRDKLSGVDLSQIPPEIVRVVAPDLLAKLNRMPARKALSDYAEYLNSNYQRKYSIPTWGEDASEKAAREWDQIKTIRENLGNVPEGPIAGPGHMYEVNLNVEPHQLLDWDKPLAEHSAEVQRAIQSVGIGAKTPEPYTGLPLSNGAKLRVENDPDFGPRYFMDMPSGGSFRINAKDLSNLIGPQGADIHGKAAWTLAAGRLGEPGAANTLREAGIPGIQYLDAGSRAAGEGTRNYVMFDPSLIEILRKYSVPAAVIGGAAAPFGFSGVPQQ